MKPFQTNIKHSYNLMVRDARDAILNPGPQFMHNATRGAILKLGAQHWATPGPVARFFNFVSPGGGICQVMHSGIWPFNGIGPFNN